METKLQRNKDGTIKGITTMGDLIKKEPLTKEQQETIAMLKELKKKYNIPDFSTNTTNND